jgi:hypothetical protein
MTLLTAAARLSVSMSIAASNSLPSYWRRNTGCSASATVIAHEVNCSLVGGHESAGIGNLLGRESAKSASAWHVRSSARRQIEQSVTSAKVLCVHSPLLGRLRLGDESGEGVDEGGDSLGLIAAAHGGARPPVLVRFEQRLQRVQVQLLAHGWNLQRAMIAGSFVNPQTEQTRPLKPMMCPQAAHSSPQRHRIHVESA